MLAHFSQEELKVGTNDADRDENSDDQSQNSCMFVLPEESDQFERSHNRLIDSKEEEKKSNISKVRKKSKYSKKLISQIESEIPEEDSVICVSEQV